MPCEIERIRVEITNFPQQALDCLRPHALLAGQPDSAASIVRWAAVELARRLWPEQPETDGRMGTYAKYTATGAASDE